MSEWIKCSDRFPSRRHSTVIVNIDVDGRGVQSTANLDFDGCWYHPDTYEQINYQVTHWMPLPPEPKDEL